MLTAWTAMMQAEFLLHGATSSTGGCAVLVVLNGPIRLELGCSGTFNALAGSDRAVVEHPISSAGDEGLRVRAVEALAQIRRLLSPS